MQRSYFIVPSLSRGPTQSEEPQGKLGRGSNGSAAADGKFTHKKKLDVFFITSRHLPTNSFFYPPPFFNTDLTIGYCSDNLFSH